MGGSLLLGGSLPFHVGGAAGAAVGVIDGHPRKLPTAFGGLHSGVRSVQGGTPRRPTLSRVREGPDSLASNTRCHLPACIYLATC